MWNPNLLFLPPEEKQEEENEEIIDEGNVQVNDTSFAPGTTIPTENNKLYNTLTIKATDTYIVDTEKLILDTGDAIWIETPDSAGSIVATISTIGL